MELCPNMFRPKKQINNRFNLFSQQPNKCVCKFYSYFTILSLFLSFVKFAFAFNAHVFHG